MLGFEEQQQHSVPGVGGSGLAAGWWSVDGEGAGLLAALVDCSPITGVILCTTVVHGMVSPIRKVLISHHGLSSWSK